MKGETRRASGAWGAEENQRDPFDLQRFVEAQRGVIDRVREELRAGRKRSHWMWFIFPQLRGLGRSSTAMHFGISSLEEARDYLRHDVLGPSLLECTHLVNMVEHRSVHDIFDYPDDLKFHSSMTLFSRAALEEEQKRIFDQALRKYFDGRPDSATLELLPP